jgi:hypothetical protein
MVGGVCGGGEPGRSRLGNEALATVPIPFTGGGMLVITVAEFPKVLLLSVSDTCTNLL